MYLFLNGVSTQGYIALLSENKQIIASECFEISGNESTKTIPIIDNFLTDQDVKYTDITNIITIVGPGSFTGIRTISLVVNTLAYIYPHISLTPVNFFGMYDDYPIVKSSSKRDLFVKYEESATIQVVTNVEFESEFTGSTIYGDTDITRFERNYDLGNFINYQEFLGKIVLQAKKQVAPLYIKKPNIS